ncbi:MAG: hypothetical protein HC882_07780 [Acidobacteria bacterium]|nr:hypothetical protein [Acidobacteriota bacterium]
MVRRRVLLATLALASLVVAAPVLAATDTGNLGVSVVLDGVCSINSAPDLTFGDYAIDSATNVARRRRSWSRAPKVRTTAST